MATRARRASSGRPCRILIALFLLIIVLYAAIAGTTTWDSPTAGKWVPRLGLDLEGGRQITLQPIVGTGQKVNAGQVNQAIDIIRNRVNGNGVTEAKVGTVGSDLIVVSLPGNPSQTTLNALAQSSQLTFRTVISVMPATSPSAVTSLPSDSALARPRTPAVLPVNPSDAVWGTQAVDNIWVQNDMAKAGETYNQLLQVYPCSNAERTSGPTTAQWKKVAVQAQLSQPNVMCDTAGTRKYLMGPSEITGKEVADVTYGQVNNQAGNLTNEIAVNLSFNSKGQSAFAKATERLMSFQRGTAQNAFAITIDGTVISAPQAQSVISDGNVQIIGNFTESNAKTLTNQLKYGALPFSFEELTSNQVSPQVGTDQLQKGILAAVIGLLLVVVYSLLQYRALGMVTVMSLIVAGVLNYGAVTLLGFTNGFCLTMAGVTGLIVSIGVTADSFIVYFERVRDEVRSGRPVQAAVETGWSRARRTIIISDTVNFLASTVLYVLSEDNVKAFAFTLGLSTIVDLLVVIMFTHPTLILLARSKFFSGGHKWSGFDPNRLGARDMTCAKCSRVA